MSGNREILDVSGTEKIVVEREGHVLLIGLNRVDRRNALDSDMSAGLARAYTELDSNPDLRVGVVYGNASAPSDLAAGHAVSQWSLLCTVAA